jgi:hypothetical protein
LTIANKSKELILFFSRILNPHNSVANAASRPLLLLLGLGAVMLRKDSYRNTWW